MPLQSAAIGRPSKRPIRIANCSGAKTDPGIHMLNQAQYGDFDVITGDYLAEMNLAQNAEAMRTGSHPGFEPTALEGLTMSLDVINDKRIKVLINGGALNPMALAEKTLDMVTEKNLDLSIAYVSGDDVMETVVQQLESGRDVLQHLDGEATVSPQHAKYLEDPQKTLVSAHAFLGARAIRRGLEADDEAGFDQYPNEQLLDLGLPIAEIDVKGHCIITKASSLPSIVTKDVVICQLLYELQGSIYLHSDVKADISIVTVQQESENRVYVSGIKGYPPPSTTKLAMFYRGGFQCELTMNATGYTTNRKYQLQEAQIRYKLKELDIADKFDTLEFQRCGIPEPNPRSQLASTTYLRIFAQAQEPTTLGQFIKAIGMHLSLDLRTLVPVPYPAYYPAIIPQSLLVEAVHLLTTPNKSAKTFSTGSPPEFASMSLRPSSDTTHPMSLSSFGLTTFIPLGTIVLARSGDKGANVNIGLFVRRAEHWPCLQSFLTLERMKHLLGEDWKEGYGLERVEFAAIWDGG
ncbi:hypothetical protein MMC13_005929 [Lambiella insularis]|nr:hypothetical protein [Lambiella insularis]